MRYAVVTSRAAVLPVLLALASIAAAQVQLQFTASPPGSSVAYGRVLQLPAGDQLLVGSALANVATGLYPAQTQHWQISFADFGSTFQVAGSLPNQSPLGGSGNDIPQDAAVDSNGNVWIAGKTDSDDFRLLNPIFGQKVPYRTAGFVAELNPTGTKLLFATFLAGQQGSTYAESAGCSTWASSIVTDASGNVYVGGTTNEADFLASPAVSLNATPCTDSFGNTQYYSFLMKISPSGQLAFGKRLITGTSLCVGGSRCINQMSTTAGVTALAVDNAGQVTVAGIAGGSWNPGIGYILKLSADGSSPLWTAATPATFQAVISLSIGEDSTGNLDLFGQYATVIPVAGENPEIGTPGLFAAQLKSDGSGFNWSSDLGLSRDARAAGILLDSSGNAWLAGTSSSAQFPALAGVPNLGSDFVLRLTASGAAAQSLFRLPTGVVTAPPAFDKNGRLLLIGVHGALLALPPSYTFNTPAIVAFANSASNALNTGLYPGALLTLYGFDLSPSLQGLQVMIDGLPAPLLYAGPNQINLQVPFALPPYAGNSPVQVTSAGGTVSAQLPESPAIGIFTVDGTHAAALNQDGTVNSASNPAAQGSVVSLFGTGAAWPSPMQDGALATAAINTQYPFTVPYAAQAVQYAGAAPGLIDGVFQVNVQLPLAPNPTIQLYETSAGLYSNFVVVYTK